MQKRFVEKSIVVTGAASGIGRATALQFAREGGNVVVSDVNEIGGEETVSIIKDAGGSAAFFRANVGNAREVKDLMRFAVDQFGGLDIGVNNAGVGGGRSRLADVPHEEFVHVMNVNVEGVFFCMQEQLNYMVGNGGVIINIASVAGLKAFPLSAVYSASKHAVLGLTKSAAVEYARKNIRINAVCPVFTRSAMFDKIFEIDPSMEQKLLRNIPVGRYGQPDDIAQSILWLCADDSGFVTGLCLPVDGGLTA